MLRVVSCAEKHLTIISSKGGMILQIFSKTDKGLVRSANEDAFAAGELLPFVKKELESAGLLDNMEKVVVCSCPRGRSARVRYGHDQSEEIAKYFAKDLGVEYLPLFRQSMGGKEQKELDSKSRFKNATEHMTIDTRIDISGRFIVLYDDMVTTGASMSACVSHAMKSGAAGVICVSLACSDKICK